MEMIMSPRAGDPPPASGVTPCQRGEGACRAPSEHSRKIMAHANQEVLRYEVAALDEQSLMRRSGSLPPRVATRNPTNHEGWEEAPRRPLSRPGPSGSRAAGPATSGQVLRQAEALERAGDERAQRLAEDRRFAALCSHVEKARSEQAQDVLGFKLRNHHSLSENMAASLAWKS